MTKKNAEKNRKEVKKLLKVIKKKPTISHHSSFAVLAKRLSNKSSQEQIMAATFVLPNPAFSGNVVSQ